MQIIGENDICIGETNSLTATGAITYIWNETDTSIQIFSSPIIDTTYSLISYDSNGCQYFDTIAINVNPLPNLQIIGPDTICQDSSAIFKQ